MDRDQLASVADAAVALSALWTVMGRPRTLASAATASPAPAPAAKPPQMARSSAGDRSPHNAGNTVVDGEDLRSVADAAVALTGFWMVMGRPRTSSDAAAASQRPSLKVRRSAGERRRQARDRQMVRLFTEEHQSLQEIAQAVGLSSSRVWDLLKRRGVDMSAMARRGQLVGVERRLEMVRLYTEEYRTMEEIAAVFGVTRERVRQLLWIERVNTQAVRKQRCALRRDVKGRSNGPAAGPLHHLASQAVSD